MHPSSRIEPHVVYSCRGANVTELSQMVVQLGTGEQLVLWALRQRRADMGATTPQLVQGFRLACGLAGAEPALASFEADLSRPMPWPLQPVPAALCRGQRRRGGLHRPDRGRAARAARPAGEVRHGSGRSGRAAELAGHATQLADVLAEAGHVLSPPASTAHPTLH